MNSLIFKDMPMHSNAESKWIPVRTERVSGHIIKSEALSLQISWHSVEGTPDGEITIGCSNDLNSLAAGTTINVNSYSNLDDPELLIINPSFKYLKLKYTANSITGGVLNAVISYR